MGWEGLVPRKQVFSGKFRNAWTDQDTDLGCFLWGMNIIKHLRAKKWILHGIGPLRITAWLFSDVSIFHSFIYFIATLNIYPNSISPNLRPPRFPPSLSLFLSWVHCCGKLHTIPVSVGCFPGNRNTINRTIFFTPDISRVQSHSFSWHRAFSHPYRWPPLQHLHMHCKALADSSYRIQRWQLMHRKQLWSPHLCSTAISFSMLFSFPSKAFLGMHLMATSLWLLFSSARTTSEKAPLKDTCMQTQDIMRSAWLFPGSGQRTKQNHFNLPSTQSPLNGFHEKSRVLLLTKAAFWQHMSSTY